MPSSVLSASPLCSSLYVFPFLLVVCLSPSVCQYFFPSIFPSPLRYFTCCSTSPVPRLVVSVCVCSLCLPSGVCQFVLCDAPREGSSLCRLSCLQSPVWCVLDFAFFVAFWFELCFCCFILVLVYFGFPVRASGFPVSQLCFKWSSPFVSPISCLLSLICMWVLHYNLTLNRAYLLP